MFQLRDYQKETIDDIYSSMRKGNKTIVVQQPPRTGKTVIMSEIARRATAKGNRVLFIVHRKEIVDQAAATFRKQNVDMNLAQLGMVQTITRHVDEIPEPQVIFIDEGHHSLAKTYQRILNKFSNAIKLLFTATPTRTGRQQLDLIADDIVVGKSIKWLTDHRNLAPFEYYSLNDINRKKLKKNSTGDYTDKSMDQALSKKIYGHIVDEYQRIANGKQAVVYCHSVENAVKVANQFNQRGISAVEVDGATPVNKRDHYIEDFRNGKTKILTNVNLFTEGLDLPNVDCVIMARPTSSLALYLQFSMRCLNPRENKTAIIVDHVENWKTFGLPDDDRDWQSAMISKAKRHKKGDKGDSVIQCEQCFRVFKRKDIKDNRCPNCGKELIKQHGYQETNDKLENIKAQQETQIRLDLVHKMIENQVLRNVADKRIGDLRTYQDFVAYAQLHGYRKRWAYVMYNKIIRKRNV